MNSKERNYYIDILKLLLAVIVALGHFGVKFFISAGFAVSFFFMISGFYIARHAYTKTENTRSYMCKRIDKIYPEYFISFLVLLTTNLIVKIVKYQTGFLDVIRYLFGVIPEALLLQGFGFAKETVNPTMWFMSVLIISSAGIYIILKHIKKTILVYAIPVFSIVSFVIIGYQNDPWGLICGVIYCPLLRGFTTMLLGVFIYYVEPYFARLKGLKKLLILIMSIFFCFIIGDSNDLYLIFGALVLLCIYTMHKVKISNKKQYMFSYCGVVSEKIYYWHYFFVIVVHPCLRAVNITSILISSGIYMISVVLFTVLSIYIQKKLR